MKQPLLLTAACASLASFLCVHADSDISRQPAIPAGSRYEIMESPSARAMQKASGADASGPEGSREKVIYDYKMSIGTGEYHYVPRLFAAIIGDHGDFAKRDKFTFGMYELPTVHQAPLNMVVNNLNPRYGGVRIGDVYYNVTEWGPSHAPTYYMRKYDMSTWQLIEEIELSDASLYSDCVAADPTTGYVYGCFRTNGVNYGDYEITIADYVNKKPYRLSALHKCTSAADRWNACAFRPDGTLFAINMLGQLMEIDKTTGTGRVIGSTGITPYDIGTAFFDPDSGKLFYIPGPEDETSAIYEIDTETGASMKLLNFPNKLVFAGAVPEAPIPADGAPGYITDAVYNFPDGSLSGTLTFTAPSKTFAGKNLSGQLTYSVLDGDVEIAQGTVTAGQSASVSVAVAETGIHDLCLALTNSKGRSPRSFTHLYIGNDSPARPEDAVLVYDDATGNVSITWTPVETSVNDGYFNPTEVTYRVKDLVTGTIVADNLSECAYSGNIQGAPRLKNYRFAVEALFGGSVSEARETNPAVPGNLELPFLDDFDGIDLMPDGYNVINVAEDLNTWTTYAGALMCHFSPLGIDMDDWLFSPPVYLEKGKIYQVAADLAARFNGYPERIEFFWGDNNHPSAMTHTGLPAFEINPEGGMYVGYENYSFNIVPEESGRYYIGIHGISDADMGSILLDNFSISDALTQGTPSSVTNLKVVGAPNGAHKGIISFTAPEVDVEGNPLSEITRIEISRGDEVVHTFESPVPGEEYSHTDPVTYGGWTEYLVTPYNSNGKGKINRKAAFIGAYIPAPVTNLTAAETENPGEVKLTWTPPTHDTYNRLLTPEDLFYNIYKSNGGADERIFTRISGTEFTFQACDAESRDFLLFGVRAVSATGEGEGVWSEMFPVGKPEPLPYLFSFTDEDFNRLQIVRQTLSSSTWEIGDDSTFTGIGSADADDAFAFYYTTAPGEQTALYTGKIGLPEGSTPMISLMVYNLYSSTMGNNTNTIEVLVSPGNGVWNPVRTIEVGQLPIRDWNKVVVPLTQYAGKNIQLKFLATNVSYPLTLIDDIRVQDSTDLDLAFESFVAPAEIEAGETFNLKMNVRNNGAAPQSDYTIDVKVNDVSRMTVPGVEVLGFEAAGFTIPMKFLPEDPENCTLSAQIIWDKDAEPDNNYSAELEVLNHVNEFNVPGSLTASRVQGNEVLLAWEAPEAEGNIPPARTEGFEDFTPWVANPDLGDWTLYDGDRGGIGGINGFTFPGDIKKGTQQSFWVMDDRADGLNQTFLAHNGHRYLSQMYSADLSQASFTPVVCDDWIISPELFGGEQTVSFYAKSYVYVNPESFEILVSDTGMEPADFTCVRTVDAAPAEWRRYEYTVPEGTKYFAVRCTSRNQFMFFVDDIRCSRALDEPFEIIGYNVYRDGMLLNGTPVTGTAYSDVSNAGHPARYYVTAVYNHGESTASNAASVDKSGVAGVATDSQVVTAVFTTDGRRIPTLEKGVCLIHYSDGSVRKVIVK